MEAYFKLLREWISKINEGDTEDVISALDKAVADWNSGKDKKKAINNINHIVSLYGLYDLPNVNGFALMVYEPFQPSDIEWFDGVLEVADTMMEVGLGSEIAQPFYAAAFDRVFFYQGPMESINRTISNGISLAESASTNHSDDFSRPLYKRTEDEYAASANYDELYKLGKSIGMFLGDWAWAKGILLQSFEKLKQSSGKPTIQFIHSLASTLADDCNDVTNASKVTRFYIDNHASKFEDFVGLVPLVTEPDYLDDSDLTEEVISKCKELARTYSDWKKLVGRIGEGIYFEKNFISIAKESLSKIENETQKKEFCECHSDCGDAQKDALVAEIRNLSIKQIQERYAAEEDDEEGGFFADLIKDFENNSGSKTNDAEKQEAIAAVTEDPGALENLEDFQGDKEVVLAAVNQDGVALEHASKKLQDDEAIVMAAMASNPCALEHANSRFWVNRELVLRYIQHQLKNGWNRADDLSELDAEQFESDYGFLNPGLVRDVWANRSKQGTSTSGKEKQQAFKCPRCGNHQIYYYQGVPARDTYYANEVDPDDGRPGEEVEICPRMDRVDEVRAETFYLCHDCMSSWRTWDECKRACLPSAEDKPASNKEVKEKKVIPAPNVAPANSDDFRAEYSQKIASGELDPAEVSYSSFLATKAKPKELNYRELYSRMISDGKIDPTETTFDEVQTVAKLFLGKDESEFKATYGQGIGSGEIDPVSTTYDEIVRVAKFLNEAAKAIAVPPPTTEELKKLYAADIGAGKIDPVEVSFEKFVASYGK